MRDRSKAEALARLKLLERALKTPAKAPKELKSACKSQGLLARMSCSDYDISPVALNSLKRAADSAIEDGGWPRLDALRREVHRLVSRGASNHEHRANGRSKDESANRLRELKGQLDEAHRFRLRLESAYMELFRLARSTASRDGQMREQLRRHAAMFSERMGLAVVDGDKGDRGQ